MNEINEIIDSPDAKMNFMKGLIVLAKADGIVDPNEQQFFLNASVALGLDDNSRDLISEMLNSDNLSPDITFVTKRQTLFFIREALQLCYMDGSYGVEEKELIEIMRKNNSVTKATVEKIEEWVVKGITWRNEGNTLLALEG